MDFVCKQDTYTCLQTLSRHKQIRWRQHFCNNEPSYFYEISLGQQNPKPEAKK